MKNFAIVGAAGYVARKHLKAIYETGNKVIAAVDPTDSVGILDSYSLDVEYFDDFNKFIVHAQHASSFSNDNVDYVSICSPNYLHHLQCRDSLNLGVDVICEKPLVIDPVHLDQLQEIEIRTGHKIYPVLQLRLHPELIRLRASLLGSEKRQHEVDLTYITARGKWYYKSWKGSVEKSGGIATNIGIHFLDLVIWLFGNVVGSRVYYNTPETISGFLELERARVRWFLSIDKSHLPYTPVPGNLTSFRSISVDGEIVNFSDGLDELHTKLYQSVLTHQSFGIEDARPAVILAHSVRLAPVHPFDELTHPLLLGYR